MAQDRQALLSDSLKRASKLMKMEGKVNKIAAQKRDSINDALNGVDIAPLTENVQTQQNTKNVQQLPPVAQRRMSDNATNMPKAILESFMSKQIDETPLYKGLGDGRDISFLTDGLVENNVQQQQIPQVIQKQYINEQAQPQIQTVNPQVDYPMIRTIVEDIVRKYTSQLGKKMLQESKEGLTEVSTIMLDKTFKFLTKSGDIYECTMKKVGNINNSKK